MQGKILDYIINKSEGCISAEDGSRYTFYIHDWMNNNAHPCRGDTVDFIVENQIATKIYLVNTSFKGSQEVAPLSIISLVFGIIAIMFNWWSLMIPSLLAIISGHIARSNIKKSKGELGGDGLALGGLILGYISLVIYFIIIIFFIGIFGILSR